MEKILLCQNNEIFEKLQNNNCKNNTNCKKFKMETNDITPFMIKDPQTQLRMASNKNIYGYSLNLIVSNIV